MRNNYVFKNNGFKIIFKPLSAITIASFVILLFPFIGMWISPKYDFVQSIKILIMAPAVSLIMFLFFVSYFTYIYFSFEIRNEIIVIKTLFHKYQINISDVQSMKLNLKHNHQNSLTIKTSNLNVKLLLIGPGGRFIYEDFFSVIDELKQAIKDL